MRFLLIALIALALSACVSQLSAEESSQPTARESNRQVVQDSRQAATTEQTESKPENSVDGLNDNGEDYQPEPQPEPTRKPVPPQNAVCPIPSKPCHHRLKRFEDWELSFRMPARIKDNKLYSSAPFYAVILKTVNTTEDCDGGEFYIALEDERKQIQKLQRERKVFASYMCPDMGAVDYDFKGKMDASGERVVIENFIAVYAGTTEAEAESLRRGLRDEYPQAVVKRMTARWERIMQ